MLLEEHGYAVTSNRIIRGKCVEHEIDAIARKGGETYLVEIKHHFNHHTYTGLDIPRSSSSRINPVVQRTLFRVNVLLI